MTRAEITDEFQAHQALRRFKRSKVLSVYFALKDNKSPTYMDAEEAVLSLVPLEFYESYFAQMVPHDPLMMKLAGLTL